ncbi:type II toxin-antitoxin system RelE/ParE family toxin [Lacipirellula sp.]|uniref:type II toxin-antitoxin system RelE/ParE family toxin n=1 Tax=Lacipirellula sp. TaxID=2691419 RepID=UPI003D12E43C
MLQARRTFAAERDLEEIVFHIAMEEERPVVAERILRELIQRCDRIAELAPIASEGTAAPRLGGGVRLLSHKRWVIIFRYDAEGVVVLRIADGSQDYLNWKVGE